MFIKNLELLLLLSGKSEDEFFDAVGILKRSKYNWKRYLPKRATLNRVIEYFIHKENIPESLFENDAIHRTDFAETIKECLRQRTSTSSPQMFEESESTVYKAEQITNEEIDMIRRIRKVYGSVLLKPVTDRICELLQIMGIDTPLFTSVLNFLQQGKK